MDVPVRPAVVCDPTEPMGKVDIAILRTQARAALTGLGWKSAIARAVDAAVAATARVPTLGRLMCCARGVRCLEIRAPRGAQTTGAVHSFRRQRYVNSRTERTCGHQR